MGTVQQQHRSCTRPGQNTLPDGLTERLLGRFPPRQLGYIARVLTPAELRVLSDADDALIVARIKRMPGRRLARYDRLVPAGPQEQRHYHTLQLQWLRDEEYLLGTRLGRRPTQRELISDFLSHRNGPRFRAYFALKYPRKMRPTGRRGAASRSADLSPASSFSN